MRIEINGLGECRSTGHASRAVVSEKVGMQGLLDLEVRFD